MRRSIIMLLGLGLALAACSKSPQAKTTPTPTLGARIASTARIAIVAPTPGQTVKGPNVTVKVKLTGGTITKIVSQDVKPDVGHVHILMDGQIITLLAGYSFTIPHVSKGPHLIQAEFVEVNHAPFYPAVQQSVSIRVI